MSTLKLSSEKHTFDELEKKYRNFVAPGFKLLIDNRDAVHEGMVISSITVETTTAQQADVVTFSVSNAYNLVTRDFQWVDKLLVPGNTLEVRMGYTDRMTPLFWGYITAVNIEFTTDELPRLTVTGMDLSFKMMRGRDARVWSNKSVTDIVKDLGRNYGALNFVIDSTSQKLKSFPKKPGNDYQLLQQLAASINYEFFIVGKTLYFRKKNRNKSLLMTLLWGKHLSYLNLEQSIDEQVSKVTVRGWSDSEQKVIKASSTRVDIVGTNSRTGPDLLKTLGTFEENVYLNVEDLRDAQEKADALLNERAMKLVTGYAECIGIPEIRAGRFIKLEGLGKRLDQPYYIQSATHTIDESGYRTEFRVQGNAV